MPELPDLEMYARNLRGLVLNREISQAIVHFASKTNAAQTTFDKKLVGSEICEIGREGKELLFSLKNGAQFSVHLMLSGRIMLLSADELGDLKAKIFSLRFCDGGAMAFCDFQRMLKVTLNPKKSEVPDALSAKFTQEYLTFMAFRNAGMNVKGFLIDQHIIRGIGNAYADEILYAANVSPESVVGKIPKEALSDLHGAILSVLKDAVLQIERIKPDIISGEERGFLKVHNAKLKETEKGEPIIKKTIATKTTYFTAGQRRYV